MQSEREAEHRNSKNMRIKYDKETDIVYIMFSDSLVAESDEEKPGIILDYDAQGTIVGIEVLNASTKMEQANSVIYEVA
jgi:uncharacterized protein YuzE